MESKREVPVVLKKVLDLDFRLSTDLLAAIVRKTGPMRLYYTYLKGLEIAGNGWLWFFGVAAIAFFSADQYVRHLMVNLFIALVLDVVVVAIVKSIARRRRPAPIEKDLLTVHFIDKFSFPSGHSTRAAMVTTLLSTQYDLNLVLEAILFSWFIGVCVCRFLMRRHFLLDIVCGIAIGWFQALFLVYSGLWLDVPSANGVIAYFFDETFAGASFDV
ncbi:polyisoprenoid diphosphate/phosphate phosphohydrolase PLPP6-like [Hyalella azteca]|uniref:Polyisoprenoid diphosphate/phosphate phosphohydrolase PLPP6-like n=1 Tax=Hyalella azteca TaxID=294128 RepID=A0A8B7MZK1_HYAAZ|nr:polyisoprenoid diphosphate/phosphate phosphohydrolase PLPP6-like [Hyalella azteca]XP_047740386.1 polyisoprenoid diphosphate/phosphate phosphohydrolase PLPP6-like [Hyalella azteca]